MYLFKLIQLIIFLELVSNAYTNKNISKEQQSFPAGCDVLFSWKMLEFEFPTSEIREHYLRNGSYIHKRNMFTNIKYHNKKIYFAHMRIRSGVPVALSYIDYDPEAPILNKSPVLKPYPNWEMQTPGDCNAIQFCEAIEIDQYGRLWVLNSGKIYFWQTAQIVCPPKLWVFDLETNKKIIEHVFPDHVVNWRNVSVGNVLNDLVVGCRSKTDCIVYIALTFESKVVVYNLEKNVSWSLKHPTFQPDPSHDSDTITVSGISFPVPKKFGIDGIALSPIRDGFDRIFYTQFKGFGLYSLLTSGLEKYENGATINESAITYWGKRTSLTDGITMDSVGRLYYGDLAKDRVLVLDTTDLKNIDDLKSFVHIVAEDHTQLPSPTSFGFDNENGYLLGIANSLQFSIMDEYKDDKWNFFVYRVKINAKSYMHF